MAARSNAVLVILLTLAPFAACIGRFFLGPCEVGYVHGA